jgi:hypothetical protein
MYHLRTLLRPNMGCRTESGAARRRAFGEIVEGTDYFFGRV